MTKLFKPENYISTLPNYEQDIHIKNINDMRIEGYSELEIAQKFFDVISGVYSEDKEDLISIIVSDAVSKVSEGLETLKYYEKLEEIIDFNVECVDKCITICNDEHSDNKFLVHEFLLLKEFMFVSSKDEYREFACKLLEFSESK